MNNTGTQKGSIMK